MAFQQLSQKVLFGIRVVSRWSTRIRISCWRLKGAKVGNGTSLSHIEVNWPHQLQLGKHCILEPCIAFKYDRYWHPGPHIVIGDRVFLGRGCEFNITEHIEIGNDCLIGSGCRFIDHNHGIALGIPMNQQPNENAAITLEEDVWLGVNVVVLKGVCIGKGAVIGAGAIVTKSIGPGEIWAGVPARQIGVR